jgi:hypothetical protein
MLLVSRKFETYVSLGNLGFSSKKVHYSLKKEPFFLRNLGPSTRKIIAP